MRRLILTTGLLAAALMATMPQSALAQANPPPSGGGQLLPNPADPRAGGPSTRPSDESVGRGEMRRGTEPGSPGSDSQRQQPGGIVPPPLQGGGERQRQ